MRDTKLVPVIVACLALVPTIGRAQGAAIGGVVKDASGAVPPWRDRGSGQPGAD